MRIFTCSFLQKGSLLREDTCQTTAWLLLWMRSLLRSPSFSESAVSALSSASTAYESLPVEIFVAEDVLVLLAAEVVLEHAED